MANVAVKYRKGQWVKLTRPMSIADGLEPAGAVGIHVGPAKIRQPKGAGEFDLIEHATLREVHLVHASGGSKESMRQADGQTAMVSIPYRGGDTRVIVAIEESDLAPVVDTADIPEDRRANMHPDFVPRP